MILLIHVLFENLFKKGSSYIRNVIENSGDYKGIIKIDRQLIGEAIFFSFFLNSLSRMILLIHVSFGFVSIIY